MTSTSNFSRRRKTSHKEGWGALPAVLDDSSLLPYMGAREREKLATAVFVAAGGAERLTQMLRESDDKFYDHYKTTQSGRLSKLAEVVTVESFEDILRQSDELRAQRAVDVTPQETSSAAKQEQVDESILSEHKD